MTHIIHMDTEIVSNLSNSIKKFADKIGENTESLNGVVKSLAWEGSSREELVSQVSILLTKVSDLKLELSELGQQLNNEIDQWIEADNGFNQKLIIEDNFIGYSIKPPIREATYLFGFLLKRDVDDVFDYFLDDKEGKELLEACKAANLRFEYIKDGEKFYFGAENGEIIQITWVDNSNIEGKMGVYSFDSTNNSQSILINKELKNNYDLRETIAHEMQHAIDYKIGRVDQEIIGKPYQSLEAMSIRTKSQEEINQINWDSLENEFGASIRERVHSEIASHSRGYEFNPLDQSGEKILNMDNTYTSSEYEIILNERDYASFYEEQVEETFRNLGLDADINVYWDNASNSVRVDIIDVDKIELVDGGIFYA